MLVQKMKILLLPCLVCVTLCVCVLASQRETETNGESQVSPRESMVFLHEYLIDARSKIAWRETTGIKGKTSHDRNRQRAGRKREITMVNILMIIVELNSDESLWNCFDILQAHSKVQGTQRRFERKANLCLQDITGSPDDTHQSALGLMYEF